MTENKARSHTQKDEAAAKSKPRPAKVTDEHRAEAARLKALYAKKKDGRSQAEFGADFGIGSQSVVWQYLNARMPLNLSAATGFAKGLKCELGAFSPRLASEAQAIAQQHVKNGSNGTKPTLLTLLELSKEEQQLVALFRDLELDQKVDVIRLANKLHNKTHPHGSSANPFPAAPTPAKKAPPAKRTTRA